MEPTGVNVLLVSSDCDAAELWAQALGRRGIGVSLVRSARAALDEWRQGDCDLVIIDAASQAIALALCRRLRSRAVNPILLLLPTCNEAELLETYRAGADECIPKPVAPGLLLAKVNAWLRHRSMVRVEALPSLVSDGIRLEPHCHQVVTASGVPISLSTLELRVLYLLMAHRGEALRPDVIIRDAWLGDGRGSAGGLRNVVRRLRLKIESDPRRPRALLTSPGAGYVFRE